MADDNDVDLADLIIGLVESGLDADRQQPAEPRTLMDRITRRQSSEGQEDGDHLDSHAQAVEMVTDYTNMVIDSVLEKVTPEFLETQLLDHITMDEQESGCTAECGYVDRRRTRHLAEVLFVALRGD